MDALNRNPGLLGIIVLALIAPLARADNGGLPPYPQRTDYGLDYSAAPSTSPSWGESPAGPSSGFAPSVPIETPRSVCSPLPPDTLYVRVDYFNWRESLFSQKLLEETGPLVNLGYLRYDEIGRFRTEIFGGRVDYDGATMDGIPIGSKTDYFGFRLQYDFLWSLGPQTGTSFLLGIGTRFWMRGLRDTTTADGQPVIGYDEMWCTVYPLLGIETRQPLGLRAEWFASAALGWTGFTYERVKLFDADLYPRMGPLAQAEIGLRGQQFSVSVFAEWMQWYTSGFSDNSLVFQPDSRLLLFGVSGGYRF
jgi:hypothetical protein